MRFGILFPVPLAMGHCERSSHSIIWHKLKLSLAMTLFYIAYCAFQEADPGGVSIGREFNSGVIPEETSQVGTVSKERNPKGLSFLGVPVLA